MKRSVLTVLLLALTGCGPRQSATGTIASEGDRINTWSHPFQGCTRDPFDGLPDAQSRSIVTFVWQDPTIRDPTMNVYHHPPDYPMRLEFSRGPQGPLATLHTVQHPGIPLDPKACSTFQLKTAEHTSERRPSLSGDIALECGVSSGHLTVQLHFDGCRF